MSLQGVCTQLRFSVSKQVEAEKGQIVLMYTKMSIAQLDCEHEDGVNSRRSYWKPIIISEVEALVKTSSMNIPALN
jgi:hypothetical protein